MAVGVSLVAIGTEITSGEVVNSNASWLAMELGKIGFEVIQHLAVPDDRTRIRSALDFAKLHSNLLVVTGGLGPTTDDFTREVIADWVGKDLKFNDSIWRELNELYMLRGLPIREAHRGQCYFPAGSTLLRNHVGTAHGFLLADPVSVFVLPGPPREIAGMWEEVRLQLEPLRPNLDRQLITFTLLGIPESEAAEVTEKVMAGSRYQLGYRASVPYVKVKVWVPTGESATNPWIEKLSHALKPWIVGDGQYDVIPLLLDQFKAYKHVTILDEVSGGRLASRFAESEMSDRVHLRVESAWNKSTTEDCSVNGLKLWLKFKTSNEVEYGWSTEDNKSQAIFQLPYKIDVKSKRGRTYLTEVILNRWFRELNVGVS